MLQFTLPATHDDLVAENLEAYIEYTVLVSQIAAVSPIVSGYTESYFEIFLKSGDRMRVEINHNNQGKFDKEKIYGSLQGARDYLTQSLGDYMKEKRL